MALIQIMEPGQSDTRGKHRLAIGIDLGTTNSLVASVIDGQARTLADDIGHHLLPSVVRYVDSGSPVVGIEAKNNSSVDPANTIVSVKRFIGRGLEDIRACNAYLTNQFDDGETRVPRIKTIAGNKTPVEISSEILKTLRDRAESALQDSVEGAVITVPAYFDDTQRQATKDAAKLAGLHVLRLLNEPTAAAIAYGLDNQSEGIYAVYDLGGGTFDISILRLNRGVFEVLATAGDSSLGGDDMDEVVAGWLEQQIGLTDKNESLHRELLNKACAAKEALTESEEADISVTLADGSSWQGRLTREKFNALIEPLVIKTLGPCRRALRDAEIAAADINDTVMVGGSTRVLLVRERVSEFFGKPALVDIDPDRVVAVGAALQADVLVGNKSSDELLLLDVIPLSLGLETMGGLVEKVVRRNTTIPITRAQEFTTFKDGQTAMSIHVLQGERELVSDCRSLARFELRGVPPMVAGAARIRVTFQVDADGLLSVTALETTTGVESHVEIKPSYGLEDAEIERMLRDSIEHARDDVEVRQLREQQVEAERVLLALDEALRQDGASLLSEEEHTAIGKAMKHLRELAAGSQTKAIKSAIKSLDEQTKEFAARRMNKSIEKAMTGHNVNEFGGQE